jgi:hypothetical protein
MRRKFANEIKGASPNDALVASVTTAPDSSPIGQCGSEATRARNHSRKFVASVTGFELGEGVSSGGPPGAFRPTPVHTAVLKLIGV